MVLTALATHQPLVEAGVLHVLRDAVIAFLLIVFVAGGFCGFLLARLIYRRRD